MPHNYYLINGRNGQGNALNILKDGKLKRDFIDISSLDLQTLDIPITKAKEILQEYNPKIDLSGMFYNASYPHCKTQTKTYATIFNYEDERVKYYFDKLKYFAEQRNYKKEHKQKIKLDENRILEDYIREILYKVINAKTNKLVGYESLMSAKIKDLIKEKYRSYPNMGINNYLNSKIYIFRNILSNYTELRNITLEYILYLQGLNTEIRSQINNYKFWENNGMEVLDPVKYIKDQTQAVLPVYNQMELADYIEDFPKVKKLNKK